MKSDSNVIHSDSYVEDLTGAEAGASIKPVIVAQFIYLDTFLVVG